MSLLANLTNDESIQNETDRVGGSGILATGAYQSKIDLAFITTSAGGAMALNLHLKTNDDRTVRSQLWMTSGKDKGCKNYYEKDGQKNYLPGYLLAESLALLTVGKSISGCDTEEKVVNLYSYEAKAEVPTKVQMVMELLNKDVIAGIVKQTVDKNVKTDAGYVPSGETRDENEIDKFFRARDGMTTAEIRAQSEKAVFIDTWKAKNGPEFVRNKAKGAAAGGTAGAPKAAGAASTKKPTTSLFA